jgi:hypothetical protein
MINTFVTFLFGLEKYLGSQPKISKHNMVPNQVEVMALEQIQAEAFPLNYGDNMMIGPLLKAKSVT